MPTSYRDASGTWHAPATGEVRIACLVPSLTELLCDLGLGKQLVARTGFCVHPRGIVKGIPKVGGTKTVDLQALRARSPTHVVLNIDENTRETADALAEFVPHCIVTHPLGPEDNFELYRLLGGIFHAGPAAERLCRALAGTLAELAIGNASRKPRRVLYLIWREPWMTVARDTYISRTLARFNWLTVPAESVTRYPEIDLARAAAEADEILLSSEPYPFREQHLAEISACCPGKRVRLIDGEMVSWYGSRAIPGLRYLARLMEADEAGIDEAIPEAVQRMRALGAMDLPAESRGG